MSVFIEIYVHFVALQEYHPIQSENNVQQLEVVELGLRVVIL